jgi:translation initiation factor 4G
MLTEMIMHDCLFKLLRSSDDEDNLECLCQLLTTIGQDLDNKQAKLQTRVDKYFQQLELMSNDRKTSARIRFMLLDTIDLRKNNWVPRREKNNPKTIEQIHKEAQEEAQEKQALIQRVTNEQRGRRLPPGPMGNVRGGAPSAGLAGNDDGWTAVSRPPRNNIVDPCRLKLTKREQVDDNVQLGPGGRGMSTWHRGSSGGGGKVVTPEPADVQRPNRYSLLTSAEQTFDSRNRPTTAASGGGRPRDYQGRMSGPVTGRTSNMTSFRASTQDSMADTLTRDSRAGVRDFMSPMSSRSASREPEAVTTAPSRTVAPVPQATPKVVQQEMSTEELERKTKSIMEEYLHLNDIKEAELCVRELSARTKSMQTFVYNALTLNLERSTQARQMTGTLLYHVIKHGIITLIDYVQGLSELLSLVDDMVIDIPMIWQYLGELISPMIQTSTDGHTSSVPLEFLRDACQPLIDANNQMTAAKLVAVVINDAVHRMGHHQVAELWQQSSLEWSDFVPAEKLDEFLLAHELHFTVTLKPVPKAERKESSTSELLELLADTELDNDKVIDWIDENVGEVNETFVRALTTAVCRPAWKAPASGGSARPEDIDEKLIKKRISLLQKYVNHQPNLEMETLYAVQLIVHEHGHPYGALRKFFDLLYDDEVVSEESFYLWRDKPEVGEQTGRGCGKLTLDQFYNWLEEDTAS